MNQQDRSQKTKGLARGRRNLLGRCWQLVMALIGFQLVWIAGSLLQSRQKNVNRAAKGDGFLEAARVEQLSPGDVVAVVQGGFYLVCQQDGSFLALSKTCTHLGCTVPWHEEKQQFICPCHGSRFDCKGQVLTPPAPRPLDYYPIKIENGKIMVDTTSPLRREAFNPSQTARI